MKTFDFKHHFAILITIFTITGLFTFLPNANAQLTGGVLNGISTMENNLILAIDDNNNESNGSFRIGFNTSGYNSNGTPKTNWAEKFTLLENGFVGIGTTTPANILTVQSQGYGLVHTNGIQSVGTYINSDGGWFGTKSNHPLHFFFNNGTPSITLATTGNFGIGTTNPSAKLDVNGQIKINGGSPGAGKFLMSDATGLATWATPTFSSQWTTTGSNVYYNTGNVGIGTASPATTLAVAASASNNGVLKVVSNSNIPNDQWWIGYNHGGISTDANDRARIGVNILTGGAGRLFFTTGLDGAAQAERMRIDETGNIGIGTSTPALKLDVRGNNSAIGLTNNVAWDHLYFSHDGATAYMRAGGAENGIAFQVGKGTVGSYGGQTYTEALRIKNNGQVGIGGVLPERFEPNCALTVNGHAYIGDFGAGYYSGLIRDSLYEDFYLWVERGVVSEDFAIAEVEEWDDYVFAKDYQLPSLQQLETFVKANKHLPNIPSEAEVKAHGYSMHKLNRGFLKTIEELSLYAINQEKKINQQQEQLDNQTTQIEALQAQMKQYEQLADEVEKLKAFLDASKK